jgi:hypothetical protein
MCSSSPSSGVDIALIALWLGHESIQTTHGYLEADLAIKEQALQKLAPAGKTIIRFKADDALLTFLASLRKNAGANSDEIPAQSAFARILLYSGFGAENRF